jgi:hypothetical protein
VINRNKVDLNFFFPGSILDVFGSILGRVMRFSESDLLKFSSVPQAKFKDNASVGPRSFPSKSFPVHNSSVSLPFDDPSFIY